MAAAATVLVTFTSQAAAEHAAPRVSTLTPDAGEVTGGRIVEIPVVYDGEDLAEVGRLTGLGVDGVIRAHSEADWFAAFGGFAPGFTYCVPEDTSQALEIPRRDSPRTAVPAGAVALAGEFSAVYPRTSPGGWQLIGTTNTPMWDSTATPPALVAPGDRVRYRAVEALPEDSQPARKHLSSPPRRPVFALDDAGLQTLYQDLSRQGNGNLGVTTSGSADRASARTANAAVGNKRNATLLENVGGLAMTALVESVICVTGADADVTVGGRPAPLATPTIVPAGAEVVVGPARLGFRTYVAVRGGLIADTELGSAATDMLSGLGPRPLAAGDTIAMSLTPPQSANSLLSNPLRVERDGAGVTGVVRCVLGPRDDWFDAAAVEQFFSTTFTVTGDSNRVGLRLESDVPLARARDGELPVAEAVRAAERSAADLGLADTRFIAGDATQFALAQDQAPQLVVVNPPRRGIGPTLADWLNASEVQHVIYSSCNARSLAADLARMPSLRVRAARLFDMFPQTRHHEVIVLLERR